MCVLTYNNCKFFIDLYINNRNKVYFLTSTCFRLSSKSGGFVSGKVERAHLTSFDRIIKERRLHKTAFCFLSDTTKKENRLHIIRTFTAKKRNKK